MEQTKNLKAIMIGAGSRGMHTYGKLLLYNQYGLDVISIAEPIQLRRESFAEQHNISIDLQFESWIDVFKKEKFADCVIITTQDQFHTDPAIAALEKGYHVLLEKPMATTLEDCQKLVKIAEEKKKILQICHVLRYTSFYSKIKEVIDAGRIGNIVNISMRENVSYYHYAHSFIRGNWHNKEKSSAMILSKCCHDLDLMQWYANSKSKLISSFGSLNHFGENNAPKGVPERCTDGCPVSDTCLYFAPRLYIDIIPLLHVQRDRSHGLEKKVINMAIENPQRTQKMKKLIPALKEIRGYSGWPIDVITDNPESFDARWEALREGPYGICVYRVSDHNVVDHQIVMVEFENGITASLTMHGHSSKEGRSVRIEGTKGTIIGEFLSSQQKLEIKDSLSGEAEDLQVESLLGGHGGGDEGLMKAFIHLLHSDDFTKESMYTSAKESLESHLMAFAAEESRLKKLIISMDDFG